MDRLKIAAHYPTIRAACSVLVDSTSECWLSRNSSGHPHVEDDSARETSHVTPTSEKVRFADNEMDQYGQLVGCRGEAAADSPVNLIQPKRDAYWLWDNLQFPFVPRETPSKPRQITWFTQMMIESEELYKDRYDKRLLSLRGRAPKYKFARFAWSVFPKLHSFLHTGQGRRLAV